MFPCVSPPQSQRRKRGPTLPQQKADGVPSQLSTFGGVVYNGPKPGGAARARREHEQVQPPCTHRYGGDSHSARGGPARPKTGTAWK